MAASLRRSLKTVGIVASPLAVIDQTVKAKRRPRLWWVRAISAPVGHTRGHVGLPQIGNWSWCSTPVPDSAAAYRDC
jgi:hypothetical protein